MRKELLPSLALSTGIVLGMSACHAPEAKPRPQETATVSANFGSGVKTELLHSRQKVAEWAGLKSTQLVLLQGQEHEKTNHIDADTSTGPVFVEGDNAVFIGARALNGIVEKFAAGKPNHAKALEEFLVFHEYGHGWQFKHNISQTPPSGEDLVQQSAYKQTIEGQADCRAGAAMKALDPTAIPEVADMLAAFPEDGQHPAGPQRADYFMHGAQSGKC